MKYTILPTGDVWRDGVVCVPATVIQNSLKFASELQLKVLLLLLSENGAAEASFLAERLGKPVTMIEDCLAYWAEEGLLSAQGAMPEPPAESETVTETAPKKAFEALPMPNLTPKDIVRICAETPEIADLLRGAERILASSLSASMKSNLVNMVTYYGLTVPVVLTLLEYYKAQRDAGKNMTMRTLQSMAKEWATDEVTTLEAASDKLQRLENADELWGEVLALCEFDYRKPTATQQKMLTRWLQDFDKEMVFFACNTMKKYNDEDKRSLKTVDNILKEWKRKSFRTPADVKAAPKDGDRRAKKDGKLKRAPSFDIEEIKKKALLNDDYDI
ncbi:MAG: DnaD domain protein [Eubacterium sp.]|nr:DnaD domain protein [Eubacterium sp.]